jgi:hypothetical protein
MRKMKNMVRRVTRGEKDTTKERKKRENPKMTDVDG